MRPNFGGSFEGPILLLNVKHLGGALQGLDVARDRIERFL